MTASEIIRNASANGVTVRLTENGKLRATGPADALALWKHIITEHRLAILAELNRQATPTTCCSCQHFTANQLNPGDGLGRCALGEPRPLPWPHASRRCSNHQHGGNMTHEATLAEGGGGSASPGGPSPRP